MSDQGVIEVLEKVLANSYMLYLKTQNYHWNVEGPQFQPMHALLEEHYTDLALAIDDIAELIRTLGVKAPGTWQAYAKLSIIADGDEQADAQTMLSHLVADQQSMISLLMQSIAVAQHANDEVVAGALTDRMAVHRKHLWMLSAMAKRT